MALRLLLIRHAETAAARKKLLVGATDVDATEDGLAKLTRFEGLLGQYSPEEWYCSPMKRALQTAEQIQMVCGCSGDITVDERLREIDFGIWEMKSFVEIVNEEPERVDDWATFNNFSFPGGDAVIAFQNRVADLFSALQRLPVKEICVVTHGGVIRTMICLALGLELKNYLLFTVQPGSLTVLDVFPEGGVLAGLNL